MSNNYYHNFLNTKEELYTDKPVSLCIYTIYNNNILYLLENSNNTMIFPHFNSTNNVILVGNDIIHNKMELQHSTYKGIVEFANQYYMFYSIEENFHYDKLMVHYLFTSIYEITFQKKILNIPIHKSVSNLFFKYKLLNYLYDENENQLNINDIVLYKCSKKELSNIIEMGIISKYKVKSEQSISTPSDFYNLLQEYLIKQNIPFNKFIEKYSKNKELSLDNLKEFIMSKGLHYNKNIINSVFEKIDIDNNQALSNVELSDLFREQRDNKIFYSAIKTINEMHLNSGSYIRISINLRSYNIIGISKKKQRRILQISEPYYILSGTTI